MCTTMQTAYNWTQPMLFEGRAIDIKLETSRSPSESTHSLLYASPPPLRPSSLPLESTSVPISTRRRTTNSLSPKRPRPYPAVLPREKYILTDDLSMATSPDYGNWTSRQENSRSTSSRSLGTSSLTNAMGDAHISDHRGTSPGPRNPHYQSMHPGMMWNVQVSQTASAIAAHHHDTFPAVPAVPMYDSPLSPTQYTGYPSSGYRNASPESVSPQSPFGGPEYTFGLPAQPTMSSDSPEEARQLPKRNRELEQAYRQVKERARQLEAEVMNLRASMPSSSSASAMGLPAIAPHGSASPAFQASWDARTRARIQMLCSLNRAGNALCAWHDSRRERRVYPPRMAPSGYLNCGCTYEEALFEESLTRNGVGSYHPGDSVRMDPSLRNPLLKLLEARFGYKDGDFERNPITGEWKEGEGPAFWEQKSSAGARKLGRSDR